MVYKVIMTYISNEKKNFMIYDIENVTKIGINYRVKKRAKK